jgi:hypothetical protein
MPRRAARTSASLVSAITLGMTRPGKGSGPVRASHRDGANGRVVRTSPCPRANLRVQEGPDLIQKHGVSRLALKYQVIATVQRHQSST